MSDLPPSCSSAHGAAPGAHGARLALCCGVGIVAGSAPQHPRARAAEAGGCDVGTVSPGRPPPTTWCCQRASRPTTSADLRAHQRLSEGLNTSPRREERPAAREITPGSDQQAARRKADSGPRRPTTSSGTTTERWKVRWRRVGFEQDADQRAGMQPPGAAGNRGCHLHAWLKRILQACGGALRRVVTERNPTSAH